MMTTVNTTLATGSIGLASPPQLGGGLAVTAPPPLNESAIDRNLGLRTTHERQRLLRQKALGWD